MEETKIIWSHSALSMLADIYEFSSQYSELSADKYVDELLEVTEKLKKNIGHCAPCRNEKLRERGYRCCLFKNHIIIYEITEQTGIILGVVHSKRNLDNVLKIIKDDDE